MNMEKNVLNTDLTGKVAVVTGAGGVLCSAFAKVLARAGAKVALLDLNEEAAQQFAGEINDEGGMARAYKCNVLDKDMCYAVANQVMADLGPCDVLINGAGGNNPRATTDKEYFEPGDLEADTKSFFDLDESGVEFVFNLNFIGTLIPTQAFARQMVGREGCNILNISSMNAYTPLTKIPAYSGAKAAVGDNTDHFKYLLLHAGSIILCVSEKTALCLRSGIGGEHLLAEKQGYLPQRPDKDLRLLLGEKAEQILHHLLVEAFMGLVGMAGLLRGKDTHDALVVLVPAAD